MGLVRVGVGTGVDFDRVGVGIVDGIGIGKPGGNSDTDFTEFKLMDEPLASGIFTCVCVFDIESRLFDEAVSSGIFSLIGVDDSKTEREFTFVDVDICDDLKSPVFFMDFWCPFAALSGEL